MYIISKSVKNDNTNLLNTNYIKFQGDGDLWRARKKCIGRAILQKYL